MTGWRPIKNAPRDGTKILVWNGQNTHSALFDRIESCFVVLYKSTTRRIPVSPSPSHWMPLPTPPDGSEKGV